MEKYSIKNDLQRQSELMYVNEYELSRVKQQICDAEKALNKFVSFAVLVIGELSEKKIKELPSNAVAIIQEELKAKYPFPNADDKFNLNAMGINPEPVYAMHQQLYPMWQPFKFDYRKEEFVANKEQWQLDNCYIYADTPERKKFFEMVNKTMEVYNEMKDAKLLRHPLKFDELFIPQLFKIDLQGNISLSTNRLQTIVNDIGRGIKINV